MFTKSYFVYMDLESRWRSIDVEDRAVITRGRRGWEVTMSWSGTGRGWGAPPTCKARVTLTDSRQRFSFFVFCFFTCMFYQLL